MAKISTENISKINDANDLIDYLALNIYEEENHNIRKNKTIPEYIKSIIDFETEYEMEGISFTSIDNDDIYDEMDKIIYNFKQTGNTEIAKYIKENIELKKHEDNDEESELDKKIENIVLEKIWI
jgi:hypothetical protein